MSFLNSLNNEQKEAVTTIEGPLLVLAGAGSGKTRVIIYRMINMLRQGIPPDLILGLTFTNKAAEEMRDRIQQQTQHQVLICTFHSLGVRILRESIQFLGYTRDFTIYDDDDVDTLLLDTMEMVGVPERRSQLKACKTFISSLKNRLQDPPPIQSFESLKRNPEPQPKIKTSEKQKNDHSFLFPQVYAHYQSKLKECNAVDFDDLLFLTVRLFQEQSDVLEHYQSRWPFLLIDEYQDTNGAQYAIVQLLVAKTKNLCVVGDPDQSIYSWRGADIRNILSFTNDFPQAKIIRLEQNYRSHTNILKAANAVIRYNTQRYEKNLWSALGPGDLIKLFTAGSERDEANYIVDRLSYYHEQKQVPYHEMAVFYRTNAQSRPFEDEMLRRRIPYRVIGGVAFYQRKEIKDLLAFLRVVYSSADYVALARTINLPKRGLGKALLESISLAAMQDNLPVFEVCEALLDEKSLKEPIKLNSKQREGLDEYVSLIRKLRQIEKSGDLSQLLAATIELSCYMEVIEEDKETARDRKDNIQQLLRRASEWQVQASNGSLGAFLEELSLRSSLDEADQDQSAVNLMTIHNGKGLEFVVGAIVGLEEGLFPHVNSADDPLKLEEERRLFYVGITRAKQHLILSHASNRFMFGQIRDSKPSRFLNEVPAEYIETVFKDGFGGRPRGSMSGSNGFAFPGNNRGLKVASLSASSIEEEVKNGLNKAQIPFPEMMPKLEVKNGFKNEPGNSIGDFAHIDGKLLFKAGDTVFHPTYGVGAIEELKKGEGGMTYIVAFHMDHGQEQSKRHIIAKNAPLYKL